jgi:hypothetical protein
MRNSRSSATFVIGIAVIGLWDEACAGLFPRSQKKPGIPEYRGSGVVLLITEQ